MADDARREILGWDQFGAAGRELASTGVSDRYRPDLLLAVARGGLLIAGVMSYALGMKNCCVINVEFYTGVDERLDVPVILPPHLDVVDLSGAHLLIVDDVADTGATLALVKAFCGGRVGEVRIATLYEKPHSTVKCDYVWRRTDDWIMFPWSTLPPVPGAVADASLAPSFDGA